MCVCVDWKDIPALSEARNTCQDGTISYYITAEVLGDSNWREILNCNSSSVNPQARQDKRSKSFGYATHVLPDAVCLACLLRPSLNLIICIYARFHILSEVLLCYMCVSFFSTAPLEVNRRLNGSILNLKCHAWPFFEVASLYEMASMYQWTSTLQEWRLVKKGLSPDWETWPNSLELPRNDKKVPRQMLISKCLLLF